MRALLLVAVLVVAGCVTPTANDATPPTSLVEAAFDRIVSTTEVTAGATATEMMVATNPLDPNHVVVTTKAANRDKVPVAVSRDGGATWASASLPIEDFESDPVLTFTKDGIPLIVTLTTPPLNPVTGALLVGPDTIYPYLGQDGGLSWRRGPKMLPDGWVADHPWIATDFGSGRIHVATAVAFPLGSEGVGGVYSIASDDGGTTWSAPVLVCAGCTAPTNAVGGDGSVYVAANPFEGAPGGQMGTPHLLFRSDDGGATWSEAIVVEEKGSRDGSRPCGLRQGRWTGLPAVAGGPGSRVHVAYVVHPEPLPVAPRPAGECPNIPDWDVMVRTSPDGGRTWADPVRVHDDGDRLAGQAVPAIATSPSGDVHVLWYDSRNDPTGRTLDVYYAHSRDGISFGPNLRVTPTSMPDNGVLNDYLGVAATDRFAILAYGVTSGTAAAEVHVAYVE